MINKDSVKTIALCLASLLVAVFCMELIFRSVKWARFDHFMMNSTKNWKDADIFLAVNVMRSSPTLGYEWLPNVKSKWLKTNSFGMLDRERPKKKGMGVYRIICIGDSTTANSDYVRILERMLNDKPINKQASFEVWNCGVTGYNLLQYCRALREKWLDFGPDMIIIGFCMNDFTTTPLVYREGKRFVGYFPKKEILPGINLFLYRNSALYRFIVYKINFSRARNYDEKIYEQGFAYLKDLKNTLAQRNISFLLVTLGLAKRFQDCPAAWMDNYIHIKKMSGELNISLLDTMPLFQKNDPEQFVLGDELHFNYAGSEIIAESIYDYIKQARHK